MGASLHDTVSHQSIGLNFDTWDCLCDLIRQLGADFGPFDDAGLIGVGQAREYGHLLAKSTPHLRVATTPATPSGDSSSRLLVTRTGSAEDQLLLPDQQTLAWLAAVTQLFLSAQGPIEVAF